MKENRHHIDTLKYKPERLYQLIKKHKIPYYCLTKESILDLIIHAEKEEDRLRELKPNHYVITY